MKKFLLVLTTALVLCVPAFADVSNDNYFGTIPGTIHHSRGDLNLSQDSGTSYFYLWNTSLYLIGEDAGYVSVSGKWGDGSSASGSYSLSSSPYGDYTFYDRAFYWGSLSGLTSTPSVNIVPSNFTKVDIGQAFNDFLNNQNNPPLGVESSFTVPSGNVLYFQVSSEQDVDFDANMPRLSSLLFGSQYGPWGNTGIKFGPAAALPTSGTTFPILSQDNVRWFIQLPTNVFGQSKIGTMQKHCLVGQWYALYCPDVFGLNETSADLDSNSTVPGASVKVSGSFSQIKVYPLTSTFDFSEGEFVTSSNDDFSSYFDGSIDENGSVTFTDQDGNVNSPAAGGQNFQDYETDPFALVENIKTILNNILSEIKSLFTFGYDAIQSLVNIMSDFVNVFQQLYAWLPSEVYTALISAIIVAITIGVFKVFL